jgi:DNA-binding response OmpR family regulator
MGNWDTNKPSNTSQMLIISDVMMPVMNGVEFCKKLKTDPLLNHIPFLMLTAKSASEAQLEGVASGADYYFAKPLSIDILTLTLKNILSQRQKFKRNTVLPNFPKKSNK